MLKGDFQHTIDGEGLIPTPSTDEREEFLRRLREQFAPAPKKSEKSVSDMTREEIDALFDEMFSSGSSSDSD